MKNIGLAARFLPFFIFMFVASYIHAQETQVIDGFKYFLNSIENVAIVLPNNYTQQEISIPSSVKYNGKEYTVVGIGKECFKDCTTLTKVILPEKLTSIDTYAFSGCSSLASIKFTSAIAKLGKEAFSGSGITTVSIPGTINIIDEYAFSKCKELRTVIIEEGVKEIHQGAFYGCEQLETISIPTTVRIIENAAFLYNYKLKAVKIEDVASWCNIVFGANTYRDECNPLYYAHNLYLHDKLVEHLIIPNTVKKINKKAFYGCTSIKSIEIPTSIDTIGSSAFGGISKVDIYINSIEKWCNITDDSKYGGHPTIPLGDLYLNRSILTKLVIPNDMSKIEWGFQGCTSIKEVVIHKNVKEVSHNVFSGCSNLTSIKCYCETPPKAGGAITDMLTTCILYVPKQSIQVYKDDANWGQFNFIYSLDGDKLDEIKQCETPTISYEDGEITFNSETPNATFHYEISSGDMGAGVSSTDANISLSGEYKISVYATAVGYNASGITTATLQWTEGKLEEKKQPSTPSLDGHEYVDLGLPSGKLWAITNLNGPTPESYGGYFMYGNMNSYATSEWGTNWEIPTKEDYEELLRYCTWTWSSVGVFNGYTVTGENGNSLFLPAAGCVLMGGSSQDANSKIYYWTKTASSTMANMAYMLSGNSSSINANIAYNTNITYAPVRLVVKNTTNAIEQTVNGQTTETSVAIYNINGIKQAKQKKGVNLMKMSNGTTKKIIIK